MEAEVAQRLQQLRDIEADISEDILALQNGDVTLEDLPEQLRSIRSLFDEGHRALRSARSLVYEMEVVRSQGDLRHHISVAKQALLRLETSLPSAIHACKIKAAKKERDSLLSDAQDQHAKVQNEQEHINQSKQITESLQRTRSMMSREILRGNDAYEMLKSQGDQLDGLNEMHVEYGAKVSVGRRLITLISRKEVLEKVLVFASFGWFLLVVLFITYARIFGSSFAPASQVRLPVMAPPAAVPQELMHFSELE